MSFPNPSDGLERRVAAASGTVPKPSEADLREQLFESFKDKGVVRSLKVGALNKSVYVNVIHKLHFVKEVHY